MIWKYINELPNRLLTMFSQRLFNNRPVDCYTILIWWHQIMYIDTSWTLANPFRGSFLSWQITLKHINEFEKIICKLWKSFWTDLWEWNCRVTVKQCWFNVESSLRAQLSDFSTSKDEIGSIYIQQKSKTPISLKEPQ